MGAVVAKRWDSFTIGTEVGVVADGTLIAGTSDILFVGFTGAERPIAIDAGMFLRAGGLVSKFFEKCGKTMARVDLRCAENTRRAVVPVRAA